MMSNIFNIISLILILSGSAFCDEEGCPSLPQEIINHQLMEHVLKCLIPEGADNDIPDCLETPEDVNKAREFFNDYCSSSSLQRVHQCLERVKVKWNQCHDDLENNHFRLLRDFIKTTLRSFCSGNGRQLMKVWQELQPVSGTQDGSPGVIPFLKDCVEATGVNLFDEDVPLNGRIFVVYGRLKIVGKCLFDRGMRIFISTSEVRSRISEILQKMKCYHPQRRRYVLCSTLNENGTDDRSCTVGSGNDTEHQIRRELINRGFQCISFSNLRLAPIDNNSLQEDFLRFLNHSCNNLPGIRDCLTEVNAEAEVCLKKARHHVFKVFQDMLEITVESGCSEEGQRLAQIYISDSSAEINGGVIGECIDISVTRFKHIPFEEEDVSTMSMKAYREANRLEQCFFKGLEQDIVEEKIVAKMVMDDLNRRMLCVDPLDDNVKLCQTIEDSPPAGD